jgi:RNA 2',3'-cyclic 3'-phosphodiesterase
MARDRASRPEAKPLRLFVAFDIPPDVRNRLSDATAPLKEMVGGRWTPPENWHLTLKFLGPTYPRLVEWVKESCRVVAAAHAPFATSLEGVGAFPNERRARILWAGLSDPEGRAKGIARALDEALAREFAPEKRAFTPHLTLARFQPPVAVEDAFASADVASRAFEVDRVVLYRSHLQRPAPRYEPLEDFTLQGD